MTLQWHLSLLCVLILDRLGNMSIFYKILIKYYDRTPSTHEGFDISENPWMFGQVNIQAPIDPDEYLKSLRFLKLSSLKMFLSHGAVTSGVSVWASGVASSASDLIKNPIGFMSASRRGLRVASDMGTWNSHPGETSDGMAGSDSSLLGHFSGHFNDIQS